MRSIRATAGLICGRIRSRVSSASSTSSSSSLSRGRNRGGSTTSRGSGQVPVGIAVMAQLTRRDLLAAGAAIVAAHTVGDAADEARTVALSGALMILHTPFTSDGAVDWDDLAREARFVGK